MIIANREYLLYIAFVLIVSSASVVYYAFFRRKMINEYFAGCSIRGRGRIIVSEILFILSLIAISAGLARPQYGEEISMRPVKGKDVVLVLDVSRSMLATDIQPSRLEIAKQALRILRDNSGGRFALIVFAGVPFMLCPLTDDAEALHSFIDSVSTDSIGVQGTDMGGALEKAYKLISKKDISDKFVYMISDGEDHGGEALKYAKRLKDEGITVYTSSVGTAAGSAVYTDENKTQLLTDESGKAVISRVDFKMLKEIASVTGGRYYDISSTYSGVFKIADQINSTSKDKGSRLVKKKKERYQIFVLIFIILAAAESAMWRFGK